MKGFLLLIALLALFTACQKNDNLPSVPKIEFLGFSKESLVQNGQDSMLLRFAYQDLEGDLGYETGDNIFIYDPRTGQRLASYQFPLDPNSPQTQEGELQLIVYSACCIYQDTVPNCGPHPSVFNEDFSYELQLIDQAGQASNRLLCPPIRLLCQ